ncbi:hypothetical protein ATANTOWER_016154 [Ataeniobius toweri]|uniref:Uncharacterized protein n=1 Tax=Ataeniobius toweri TaxID=208326 RepID=A0ABU7C290_9TELE|nr:hypothetical protein [Ataeniobius toweri]
MDEFRPHIKCGAYFLPATLPAGGWGLCPLVYCGSPFLGLDALVCAASLLVAACRGLDPWALSGLCLGSDMSWGLGSLGPWLDLLGRGRLPAGPVGSSLHLSGTSALWLLGGSPVTLPLLFSGGVAVVLAVVLLGFLCSGGPLDICGSDILHICPRSRGAGLWVLILAIAYFYGETLYTQVCSHSDPQVFRLRC